MKCSKITLIFLLFLLVIIGCSQQVIKENHYELITPSNHIFTVEDLIEIGFKEYRRYDVSELNGSTHAIYGFWGDKDFERKEFELRFYRSHQEAVDLGESLAVEASGTDAILKKSESNWTEGLKDRRTIGGPGPGGGGRSGSFPKYGNYSIFGNIVMLCEGGEGLAINNCWKLINKLSTLE